MTNPRYLVYAGNLQPNASFHKLPEAREFYDKLTKTHQDVHLHDTKKDKCLRRSVS